MTDVHASHFCPACGTRLEHVARYPWYFCKECCRTASDGESRAYRFRNAGFSGGFEFALRGDEEWFSCLGVICLIKGRPAYVHEARFGGIVAEPIPSLPFNRSGVIDIRKGIPDTFIREQRAKPRSGFGGLPPTSLPDEDS